MKYHLLAGAAAMALLVGGTVASSAADLPAPEVPMIAAAPAVYDWTGFYAGVHLGYGWGEFEKGARRSGFNNRDIDGILGGGQVGGNWQFDSFVLGIEADASGTGFDGDKAKKYKPEGGIFGTVRGRVGFAWDRFLVFGTGGFAYSDVNVKAGRGNNNDDWRTGWTAGGGVEAAVTDNISVKIEYLYADLGEGDWINNRGGRGRFKADYDQSLVRLGVNYKF